MNSSFYIIGYCGRQKYWLRIKQDRKFLAEPVWEGLKDNATKFKTFIEADQAMKAIEHLVKIDMEVK